jgi:hypothetical protein
MPSPATNERALGARERLERALDRRRIARAAERAGRVDARARALLRDVALLVENVRRDVDDRRAGRRARRLAERHADVDSIVDQSRTRFVNFAKLRQMSAP